MSYCKINYLFHLGRNCTYIFRHWPQILGEFKLLNAEIDEDKAVIVSPTDNDPKMVWYQHFGRKRIFSGEMEHSGVSGGFDRARFFHSQSAQMTSRSFPPGSNLYINWSTISNNQSYHQDPLMSKWTGPHPDSYLIMHHSVNEILPPHLHFINTWNLSIPPARILTKNKFFVKTNKLFTRNVQILN